jgi:2-polyprenyl-3-methyl-5-hydroxy-6-metoxy-1,4-benzoquinol methylase
MNNKVYTRCKVCEGGDLHKVYTSARSGLPVLNCRDCGLFFVGAAFSIDEQHSVYAEEDSYAMFVQAERSVPEVARRYALWASELRARVGANCKAARRPRLLDVGCGAGDFMASCAREGGFEVTGLEISPPAVRMAADCYGFQVHLQGIQDHKPAQLYDVVTMLGVLEHVLDPRQLLEHAVRLLNPSGVLFIYTPVWGLYDVLAASLARACGGRLSRLIDRRINAHHLQIFPSRTLTTLLSNCGTTVLSCQPVCEYNLPIDEYLQSLGIRGTVAQRIATAPLKALVKRHLFFRNNMKVFAAKKASQ